MVSNHYNETSIEARISILENDMERLLGNGQPGMIAKLESQVSAILVTISGIDKTVQDAKWKIMMFVIIIVTAIMVAGSGTISLKTLIELIK